MNKRVISFIVKYKEKYKNREREVYKLEAKKKMIKKNVARKCSQ